MNNIRLNLLFTSLFMVYTEGLWQRLFSLGPQTTIMFELPLWLYFIFSQKYFLKNIYILKYLFLYIIISFVVASFNGFDIIGLLKYIRFFVYFILIYISIWSTRIDVNQWYSIMGFLIFLIIIQGIGSSFSLFILGQRIEGHVGLMSSLGGTTAAIFPLVVCSISYLIYLFTTQRKKKLNYILLFMVIGSVIVGYASGKRVIFFSLPLFAILTFGLTYFKLKMKRFIYGKLFFTIFLIFSAIPIYIFGISTSKGLNYNLEGNETNVETITTAVKYAEYYDSAETIYGKSMGRTLTSRNIINSSIKSTEIFLFGNGFDAYKDENFLSSINVIYGVVGFTRDIISGGWLLMFVTLIIYIKIIKFNISYSTNFTNILRNLILMIFIYTYFTYSSDFTVSLKIPFIIAIILALINSPFNRDSLIRIMKKYSISN